MPASKEELAPKIDICIKALGTMVVEPTWVSDPNNLGQKYQGQPVQRPILQNEDRTVVEKKLLALIEQL